MATLLKIRGLDRSETNANVARGFRIKSALGKRSDSGTKAKLDVGTSNSKVTYTAQFGGAVGNNINIVHALAEGTGSTPLSVAVTYPTGGSPNPTITVNLATAGDLGATATLTSDNTEPADGDTVTVNDVTYRFKDAPAQANDVKRSGVDANTDLANLRAAVNQTGTASKATAVLASDGTEPVDADTVTINDITYRFKDTPTQANDIQRSGTSSDADLDNLVAAVNQSGTPGVEYFAGTVAPTDVTAAARTGTGVTGKVTFTATTRGVGGNAYPSTEASIHLSFTNGVTFTGGDNFDEYFAGTVAPTDVTAGTVNNTTHKLVFTAGTPGPTGDAYASTETSSHLSFGGTTFSGGDEAATSTATQVAAAVNAHAEASRYVVATAGGTGAGVAVEATTAPLATGADGTGPLENIYVETNDSITVIVDIEDPFTARQLFRAKGRFVELGQQ